MRPKTAAKKTIICAAVLLSAAILLDARALFQSEYAVGVDGYYYVLQVDTFLRYGNSYFPTETPLVLCFLTSLAFIIGDSVLAIKIGAILLQAGLCLGILAVVTSITRNILFGIFGMAIAAFSNLHLYLLGEFINNLGALTLLVWGGFGLVRFRQTGSRVWLILALTTLVGALLSHRSTLWVIIVGLISLVLSWFFLKAKTKKSMFFVLLLLAILLTFPLAIYWQPIIELPLFINEEILKFPRNPFRQLILAESMMILLALFVWLRSLWVKAERFCYSEMLALTAVLAWSFLTTLNPFLNHQTGFHRVFGRLDILVFVQAAIAVPLSISLATKNLKLFIRLLVAAPFAGLLCWSYLVPPPVGLSKEYLEERQALIRQLQTTPHLFCDKPLIIAPHGKQFVVTSVLGIPSQQTPPGENLYQCIYWLVQKGDRTSPEFVLIEDSEFRKIVSSLSAEDLEKLISSNPHLNRFKRKI